MQRSLFLIPALLFLLILHVWLHNRQPIPYMDELFHIPQAQNFCLSFRTTTRPVYHPSITTLPALYLPPSLLHLLTLGSIPCTSRILRLHSLLASFLILPTLHALLRTNKHANQHLHALILWLHPVSLFYSFLFYTDPQSNFLLLLAWHISHTRNQPLASLTAFLATLTRQTNMVWHFYIAASVAIQTLLHSKTHRKQPMSLARTLLKTLYPHALPALLYLSFLLLNHGPALGDKSHHAPTLHWAMLPYFLAFHALSYLPFQLFAPRNLASQLALLSRSKALQAVAAALCAIIVTMVIVTGDYAHPFARADNRHYVFYIYRKWLLRSQWRRLILVPLYSWGVLGPLLELELLRRDGSRKKKHEAAGLDTDLLAEYLKDILVLVCATVTLVPSSLLEPRYFVVGSTILSVRRLARCKVQISVVRLIVIAAALVLANVALVYVFAELPFERPVDPHMPGDLSPGRFMF